MGNKVNIIATLCCLTAPCYADVAKEVAPIAFYSSDTDEFDVFRKGIRYKYQRSDNFWHGVEVDSAQYITNGWSENVESVYYVFDHAYENSSVLGKLGVNSVGKLVGDFNYNKPINDKFSTDIYFERQAIDSKQGIIDDLYYSMYGGVLSYDSLERFSAAAVYALQDIGDGNNRSHVRGRLTYTLSSEYGLHSHLIARNFYNSKPSRDVYFNPDTYERYMAGLSMRRWFDNGSMINVAGYLGPEYVNSGTRDTVFLYEVQYKRPTINSWNVALNAGSLQNSNSYGYTYISIQVGYVF